MSEHVTNEETHTENGAHGDAEIVTEHTADIEETASAQNGDVATASEVDELRARLEQLEQEVSTSKDAYMRATADLRNFKRRTEEDRTNLVRNASASVILKLLPVLDDFDLAMQHAPEDIAQNAWFSGVRGIQRKLQMILETEGVKPIEAEGQPFDPHFHEAVMHEDAGDENSGKVVADLRRGYTLHDRVLRPSMVKVGQ